MSRNVWDSRLDVSCTAVGKEQEIVGGQTKKILKWNHDSVRINLSSSISSTEHCGGIVFRVCGTVATPTQRRSEQHWFPDWSQQCRSNGWQHQKHNGFLHMNNTCNAASAVFTAGFHLFSYNMATQTELQKSTQDPRIEEIHFPIIKCGVLLTLPFTAAW